MSKIDDKIINNIKVICLDMISKAGSGDAGIIFSSLNLFYNLFKNHLVFDPNNKNFINRDRIVVSSRLLPLLYTCQTLFYKDMVMEDLKEYKAFNSNVSGLSKKGFVDMGSIIKGDVISSSVGISLGEEYLKNLLKIENSKAKLIDFKTYCIVTLDELMSGISYEAMSFASSQDLKNLIFIVIKDEVGKDSSNKETFKDNLLDHFISLNFNVSIINDSTNSINGAIEDAKDSKKPSVIIIKSTYGKSSSIENSNKNYNIPLPNDELLNIKNKAGIVNPFIIDNQTYSEINKMISKRLGKYLINYQSEKQKLILDLKIKEIIDFLEKGKINLDFNSENIKINENYEEELLKSNNKILNVLASKSPFILCGSNDNFIYTLASINKSSILNKENRLGRNILFGNRILAMGGVSCGLASLGFKIFLSTPLINENFVEPFIIK